MHDIIFMAQQYEEIFPLWLELNASILKSERTQRVFMDTNPAKENREALSEVSKILFTKKR